MVEQQSARDRICDLHDSSSGGIRPDDTERSAIPLPDFERELDGVFAESRELNGILLAAFN